MIRITPTAAGRGACLLAGLFCACLAREAVARQRPSPPPKDAANTLAADADDRAVRASRAALEAGRAAEAVAAADAVLARQPGHLGAAGVKVEALLASGDRTRALDAYEAWHGVVRIEDSALLARIAVAELEALQADPLVHVDALAALTTQRGAPGTAARAALTKLAEANPPTARSWPAVVALSALGDAAATRRVVDAYRQSSGSARVTALQAIIAAGGPTAEPILREALGVRDAMVQSTAAEGAARLQLKGLIPALQEVARSGEMFAKFSAAVALARLGAPGGEALVDAGASSPAMDARYQAALARKARGDRTWVDAMRRLLETDDVGVKYEAAGALLETDRASAMKVLQAGTTDPNPAVRTLVAGVLVKDPALPVSELRRLLRDGVPRVRLLAASSLLRRAALPR